MDNLDCILNIAIHSNFTQSLLYAQTCSRIYDHIWKLKLKYYFPHKRYFNFWSGSQNYLIHSRKKFMLTANIEDRWKYTSNKIYEYDPMLEDILQSNIDEKIPNIFIFNIKKRFIVLRHDWCYDEAQNLVIAYCSTKKNAISAIKKNQLILFKDTSMYTINNWHFSYVIIDLKYANLIFWKIRNRFTETNKKDIYTFYNGKYNKPIEFQ